MMDAIIPLVIYLGLTALALYSGWITRDKEK